MKTLSEKYRPKMLDDCVGVDELRKLVRGRDELPHLLLFGPPGVGKTTVAHCIANERLGDFKKGDFYEINASAERGIDVIRSKVIAFMRLRSLSGKQKILLLDEADSITKVAFEALRRPLETGQKSCCVILTANHVEKVHEAIQSRCAMFEFTLDHSRVIERFKRIAELEGFEVDENVLDKLIKLYGYDLRKLLNQYEIWLEMGSVKEPDFMKVVRLLEKGDWKNASKVMTPEMLAPMFDYMCRVSEPVKMMKLAPIFALYDWRLSSFSTNPMIQLQSFCVDFCRGVK